jgi:hypothetical protein
MSIDLVVASHISGEAADYKRELVSEVQVGRALQDVRAFVQAIQEGGKPRNISSRSIRGNSKPWQN